MWNREYSYNTSKQLNITNRFNTNRILLKLTKNALIQGVN